MILSFDFEFHLAGYVSIASIAIANEIVISQVAQDGLKKS